MVVGIGWEFWVEDSHRWIYVNIHKTGRALFASS
jgi:hypothetical protein